VLIKDTIPLELAQSVTINPRETRLVRRARKTSDRVRSMVEAASAGITSRAYAMSRSWRPASGRKPSSAVRNNSAGNNANKK
jgi:hypothetical protein